MSKKKRKAQAPKQTETQAFPNAWLFGIILLALVVFTYLPAWNGRPIWDDDAHITKPELQSVAGFTQIWIKPGSTQQYYPLVHTVFWIEHRIWGSSVLPYHLVNIFLHAFSAFLLWRILVRLKVPGGWLAASIFALHPVQVESVAWISELKNTLSGALLLSSVLVYLRFDESRKRGEYAAALCLFVLGLLSKSVIATLPAALLVIFWWKRGKLSWKNDLLPLVPFFVTGVAAGLFTAWVERTYIGAHGTSFALSFLDRCLIAGRVFWFYIFKLAWPTKLTFIYPRWNVNSAIWWQYLFPLSAVLLFAVLWKLRTQWRGPLAAFLIFAGTLFPVLGFLNVYPFVYSYVADHFQYLASIGIITLASAGIAMLLRRVLPTQPVARRIIPLALLLVLGVLSWGQASDYKGAETLYLTTLAKNPDCWLAHNNLSAIFLTRGQTDEALDHARKALELQPNDVQPHITIGDALTRKRRLVEAIDHYKKALAIRPDYAEGYSHLGSAYLLSGQFTDAIRQYEKTLSLASKSIAARNNLAWLLATCADTNLRDGAKAIKLGEEANQLSGDKNPVILHTLSVSYAEGGQIVKAMEIAHRAIELAQVQNNRRLVETLQKEIAVYESQLASPADRN